MSDNRSGEITISPGLKAILERDREWERMMTVMRRVQRRPSRWQAKQLAELGRWFGQQRQRYKDWGVREPQ